MSLLPKRFLRTKRHGDTLAEVSICVGIFAMVLIGAIVLINLSMNTAQASLETTIARSEIDTQAEALRFIHEAYSAQRNLDRSSQQYVDLWKSITTDYVNTPEQIPEFNNLSSCDFAYDELADASKNLKAFILNPRLLSPTFAVNPENLSKILLEYNGNTFGPTSIFPQILYRNTIDSTALYENLSGINLSANTTNDILVSRAEGIWVMVACGDNVDNCDSSITDKNDPKSTPPSYYDFYIRSCWNPAGRNRPTTISTSIRLYNPDVKVITANQDTFTLTYYDNDGLTPIGGATASAELLNSHTFPIEQDPPAQKYDSNGIPMVFLGWVQKDVVDGTRYSKDGANGTYTSISVTDNVSLVPSWGYNYKVIYDPNTSDPNAVRNLPANQEAVSANTSYNFGQIPDQTPVYSSSTGCYIFLGWSTNPNGPPNSAVGTNIIATSTHPTVTYYAIWNQVTCHDYQIRLTWGATPRDLDSHIKALGGTSFHVYYNRLKSSTADLDLDDTSSYGPEVITLDTKPDTTYTYYVHCYSRCNIGSGAKVELLNAREGSVIKTCKSTSAAKNRWRVFTMNTDSNNVPTIDYGGNNCQ